MTIGKYISEASIDSISFTLALEMRKCFGALKGDIRLNELYGEAVVCPAVEGCARIKAIKG
jgi:hypothetical protein